jgi:hypothetical protein
MISTKPWSEEMSWFYNETVDPTIQHHHILQLVQNFMLSLKIWTRIFTPQNLFYFIHCYGTYYISANKTIDNNPCLNHNVIDSNYDRSINYLLQPDDATVCESSNIIAGWYRFPNFNNIPTAPPDSWIVVQRFFGRGYRCKCSIW